MAQKCFLWAIVYAGLFTPGVILESAWIGVWGFSEEKRCFIFMFKIYFWGRKGRFLCFVHSSKMHFTVKFLVPYPAVLYLFVEIFDLKHIVWVTEGLYLSFFYLTFCWPCPPCQINKREVILFWVKVLVSRKWQDNMIKPQSPTELVWIKRLEDSEFKNPNNFL